MKHLTLAICSLLLLFGCNSKNDRLEHSMTNKEKKIEKITKQKSPQKVTLSFKNIEIGKEINKISSSCFKSDKKIEIKGFELIPNFVCSVERLQKSFYTSIVAGYNNNKYMGKVLVYTEEGGKTISKVVYYVPITSDNTYPDIYTLYEDKYGKPTTQKTISSIPFETINSTWIFANNMRLTIAKREYTGESYGPFQEIARIGKMKNCVEVIYYDYSVQIQENKIKLEAKKKAETERLKKIEIRKQEKDKQDI